MRRVTLGIAVFLLSACTHHVTVPQTTPDPAIGHEHTLLQRVAPCAMAPEALVTITDADTWRAWCVRGSL